VNDGGEVKREAGASVKYTTPVSVCTRSRSCTVGRQHSALVYTRLKNQSSRQ